MLSPRRRMPDSKTIIRMEAMLETNRQPPPLCQAPHIVDGASPTPPRPCDICKVERAIVYHCTTCEQQICRECGPTHRDALVVSNVGHP